MTADAIGLELSNEEQILGWYDTDIFLTNKIHFY